MPLLRRVLPWCLLGSGVLFSACDGDEPSPAPAPAALGTVQGRVVDLTGAPLAGARVLALAQQTTSDADGRFVLGGLPDAGTVPLTARHPGMTTAQQRVELVAGAATARLTLAPTTQQRLPDAAAGGIVQGPDGLELEFSGTFRDGAGQTLHGPVDVGVRRVEATELAAAPPLTDEHGRGLQAEALVAVELEQADQPVHFTGTVRLRLPSQRPAQQGAGTWTYDEARGRWQRAGSFTRTEGVLELTLPHLSWWMVGSPAAASGCVGGTLLVEPGKPAAGALLFATGVDLLANSNGVAEADGTFCLPIPATGTVRLQAWAEAPDGRGARYREDLVVLHDEAGLCGGEGCRALGELRLGDPATDDDGDGLSEEAGDCDDADPKIQPGAAERCNGRDDDCDGAIPLAERDADGDGVSSCAGDCDDDAPGRYPGASEDCNGEDDDCDGSIGEDEQDADGDGVLPCAGDCDDREGEVHPGAAERCNGQDDDCDGVVPLDEHDADGDGFSVCAGDCDDTDPTRRPGQPERCNGIDDDCDGTVPAAELDGDGDGQAPCAGDCDDGDPARAGGVAEQCNGTDDDCDGAVPEEEADADEDGWRVCAGDCDDGDALVFPGQPELCDGRDNDCDGVAETEVVAGVGTLQDALDAAAPGATLCVGPGTYTENLVIDGKELRLIGRDGADRTILDGGGRDSTLVLTGGLTTATLVEGFTITGGVSAFLGGGVRLDDAGATLRRLIVHGNQALLGGGVSASGLLPFRFERLTVRDNEASSDGGGLYLEAPGAAAGLWVTGNAATSGGGLVAGDVLTLEDLFVADNGADRQGGGLVVTLGAEATVERLFLLGNRAEEGGGFAVDGGTLTATGLLVAGCVADEDGGGGLLRTGRAVLTLTQATFDANEAGSAGGGLFLRVGEATLTNVLFAGGRAGSRDAGGGVHLASGPLGPALHVNWGAWWDNQPFDLVDEATGELDPLGEPGGICADPAFPAPLTAGVTPLDYHLGVASALIDAGDPTRFDPDGSISDPGAFGGEGAGRWDLDGDGAFAWYHPGPYDVLEDAPAGWDPDDLDAAILPLDDVDRDGDGFSRLDGDCDDAEPLVHPGAAERCNGLDDDCDGALPPEELDEDEDGWTVCGGDCHDGAGSLHPGVAERCNGVDDDCDGRLDPEEETDADGDGSPICADCNDGDPDRTPGAVELCNGQDDDCDDATVEHWLSPRFGRTLQEAIDDAADGDVLCLLAGTYPAGITIAGKRLSVVGVHGAGRTILQGDGGGSVVVIEVPSLPGDRATALSGLTLTGGLAEQGGGLRAEGPGTLRLEEVVVTGNEATADGGGAYLSELWSVVLRDLTLSDNVAAGDGGGLHLSWSRLELAGTLEARDNLAGGDGGGVLLERVSSAQIAGLHVHGNQATRGGGAAFRIMLTETPLEQSRFLENEATGAGGGLFGSTANLLPANLLFRANRATDGGGVYLESISTFQGNTLIFSDQQATAAGGAIYADFSQVAITQASFVGNQASSGAALYLDLLSELELVNAAVIDNAPSGSSGAILLEHDVPAFLRNCAWYGNGLNDVVEESAGPVSLPARLGHLFVDPQFLDYDPAAAAADWDLHLAVGSPLIDAGWVLRRDPDGGRSDIGAYGGARADDWDLDRDGAPSWWHAGPYDEEADPLAGWDPDDEDPDAYPRSTVDEDEDGYAPADGDCDDDDDRVHPGAAEVCDGVDTDCDGRLPLDELDRDGDGFRACGEDCDDDDPDRHPGATERCNGLDDDCDDLLPEEEQDRDEDGATACGGDCDEADPTRAPGAEERCNGIDDDCDGRTESFVVAGEGTIQEAIAGATEGDTICVGPGRYAEHVRFGRLNLRLIATAGPAATTLAGDGTSSVVQISGGQGLATLLEGFTVTGGRFTNGGGLLLGPASSATLRRLVLEDNEATASGGGIHIGPGGSAVLDEVVLRRNRALRGGGLSATIVHPLTLERTIFTDNEAEEGGGLYLGAVVLEARYLELRGNRATSTGGGLHAESGELQLVDTALIANDAGTSGGGLYLEGGDLSLARGALFGNTSAGDGGGGTFWWSQDVQLSHLLVAGNEAAGAGGGLHVTGCSACTGTLASATLTIDHASWVANVAGTDGGGLLLDDTGSVTVTNVLFAHHEANAGGAALVEATVLPDFSYCAFWENAPANVRLVGAAPTVLIGVHGNLAADPEFVQRRGDVPEEWDLHLLPGSALIDAGDPAVLDPDGSICDIGAYGGLTTPFDLDGDGYPQRWSPGAYRAPEDALAGWDPDDLDAASTPIADRDEDGRTPADGDCDDAEAAVHPGATEECNGRDDDCDGLLPAAERDEDEDGFTPCGGDCDDAVAAVHPGASEPCNGRDDDCDGLTDEERCYTCTLDVPGDHGTIRDALAAAVDGDVVCVQAGRYRETVDFAGKQVQLIGVDGAARTVIDGDGAGSVVRFARGEGPDTLLQGFTLTKGRAGLGGGLYVEGSSPTLRSLVVQDCEATGDGGGVYLTLSGSLLEDVSVIGNRAAVRGGGLYARHSGFAARRLLLSENTASTHGGGAYLTSTVAAPLAITLTNLIVSGNVASQDGGGVYLTAGAGATLALTIQQASLVANQAGRDGAALFVATPATLTLVNADVSSNVAGGLGGGVLDGTAAGITALFDNFHGNTPTAYEGPLGGFVARPTLLGVDPAYRDLADPRPHRWDLHLDSGSGLIDRGDWTLTDPDGSRSDVGAYGGVHAARWDRDGDGAFGRWSPGPYDGVTDLAAGLDPDDGDPLLSPSSDRDGDGFTPATGDCDDGDPEIHPGAPERCNGRDDDCDGDLGDEAVDADGDGLSVCDGDCDDDDQDRSPAHEEECNGTDDDCDGELGAGEQDEDGDGFRVCAGDCDDGDPLVHPWALERCNGQDDDCDGEIDTAEWDGDDDGVPPCAGDCDDQDGTTYPGALELCDEVDNDCDGSVAEETADRDGDGKSPCTGDCDDDDPTRYTGAVERCNGRDDNCDGRLLPTERDLDGDGWFSCNGDCVDTDPTRHPGAVEGCNGIDDDCDGSPAADELDRDGDGWAPCEGDCDDLRAEAYPDAAEQCNGLDDDCDGRLALGEVDRDEDGQLACAGDCDDLDPRRFAGAKEGCDGQDESCGVHRELHVPGIFGTIGLALEDAAAGDVICVAAGHYPETLDFAGKNVQVVGLEGAARTFIDGGEAGSVVRFATGEGPDAGLEGVTLINGRAAKGGGLYVYRASPTLRRVVLRGNTATSGGGGGYFEDASPRLEDCEVFGNSAPSGAGLQWYAPNSGRPCAPTLIRLWIHGNFTTPGGAGGGVHCSAFGNSTGGLLSDSRIEDNEAANGGGLNFGGGCATTFRRLIVAGNRASGSGAGIHTYNGEPPLSHVLLLANVSPAGSATILVNRASPSWSHLAVIGNTGAVVGLVAGEPSFTNSLFAGNRSTAGVLGYGTLRGCSSWDNVPAAWSGNAGTVLPPGEYFLAQDAQDVRQWDLHLAAGSPLVDSGVPGPVDVDLSPVDPGVYGGTSGAGWDLDGDGHPLWWHPGPYDPLLDVDGGWDCDDQDPAAGPTAGCGG